MIPMLCKREASKLRSYTRWLENIDSLHPPWASDDRQFRLADASRIRRRLLRLAGRYSATRAKRRRSEHCYYLRSAGNCWREALSRFRVAERSVGESRRGDIHPLRFCVVPLAERRVGVSVYSLAVLIDALTGQL